MMKKKKTQYKQHIHNILKAIIIFLSFMLIVHQYMAYPKR